MYNCQAVERPYILVFIKSYGQFKSVDFLMWVGNPKHTFWYSFTLHFRPRTADNIWRCPFIQLKLVVNEFVRKNLCKIHSTTIIIYFLYSLGLIYLLFKVSFPKSLKIRSLASLLFHLEKSSRKNVASFFRKWKNHMTCIN